MSRVYGPVGGSMSRFAVLALLALCACGEDVCDRAELWADQCKVSWTDADKQACRSDLKSCTAKDRRKLDAFWFCMEQRKFFECRDPGGDTGLTSELPPTADDLAACRAELDGVPITCSRSIGVDVGTFGGLGTTATETE